MAQKKRYSRYFIILQEDEKGYSLGVDKSSSGYVKLETKNGKCKISYYVQNVKKESAPYYMVLICNKKDAENIIKIGEMNIDEHGRADICYEYTANNIADTGLDIEKISGAAIVKFIDSNVISVLSGFSTTDIPKWKNFKVLLPKVRTKKEKESVKEDDNIFDEYEEHIEKSKISCKDKNNKIETLEQNEIKIKAESDIKESSDTRINIDIEEETIDSKDDEEKNNTAVNEDISDVNDDISQKINIEGELNRSCDNKYPKGVIGNLLKTIVKDFPKTEAVNNIKRCNLYRVKVDNLDDMKNTCDYSKFMIVYNPMLDYYSYIKNYGHYLMGYKWNKDGNLKYLVYGIPGNKNKEQQPFEGRSGFTTWMSNKDDYGYWLMFYDYKDSTIAVPEK